MSNDARQEKCTFIMVKASKRKVPFAARKQAGSTGNASANPFEAVKGKQRFNVLGRKASSTKNVNKTRSDAIDMVRCTVAYAVW